MKAQSALEHPSTPPVFCTGFGQNDTHAVTLSDGRTNPHPSAGHPYDTITGPEIVAIVEHPPSLPKERAQWFIPSAYAQSDGRSHEVQQAHGAFYWLALDVDQNNLALSEVREALSVVLGPCSTVIYATRSATPDARKWRALVRLGEPLAGADYSDTVAAFYDLLEEQTEGVLICDRALERTGQLVYLPNRGDFYEYHVERATPLALTPEHPVIQRRETNRSRRSQAEAEAQAARARKAAQRLERGTSDDTDPVVHFNEAHSIADLLERYGYTRGGHGDDWRSPMQQSGSFATRDYGDHWISLSGSDDAAEIGAASKSGHRFGDAFDLYAYFEHGGDLSDAVRSYAQEVGLDHRVEEFDAKHEQAASTLTKTDTAEQSSGDVVPPSSDWPAPSPALLRPSLPEPPVLPLIDILGPRAAEWVSATAEAAGAPADYVVSALFAAVGGVVGNARWVSPWKGWAEPPVIWSMCVGLPSAGKSPAIDAVLSGVRRAEKPMRTRSSAEHDAWVEQQKLAKIVEQAWEAKCRKAMGQGAEPPALPTDANAGPEPHIPRLIVNDGTVEKIGVIAEAQPKGVLQVRDELSGWLLTMEARNGGSDRAFWLEAYGGRSFTVERMGRRPLTINRLTIGVLGGIQPDKLNELLVKASDDGLVARFMPTWPAPAPVRRPTRYADDAVADEAWARLVALDMPVNADGEPRPWFAGFDDGAAALMDGWRQQCSDWETEAAGLLMSHIGKFPGLAARLSLVLAAIDHAFDGAPQPNTITVSEFGRACHYIEAYALPMARRCYAGASVLASEAAARRLLAVIREEGWRSFTTRQVMRQERVALGNSSKLDPALAVLLEGDCIRPAGIPKEEPKGGRAVKAYEVNPGVLGAANDKMA